MSAVSDRFLHRASPPKDTAARMPGLKPNRLSDRLVRREDGRPANPRRQSGIRVAFDTSRRMNLTTDRSEQPRKEFSPC